MNKCYIIYHDDLDGECSAAIATKYCNEIMFLVNDMDIVYIKGKHDGSMRKFPLEKNDYVIVLDYTLREDLIKHVMNSIDMNRFIWIDHHISKKDLYEKWKNIKGSRDTTIAACEQTWYYFYSERKTPSPVRYIGDMDVWKWEYKNSANFCEYMLFTNTNPNNEIWEDLLDNFDDRVMDYVNIGYNIRKARLYNLNRIINENAYMSKIDNIPCVKINFGDFTSTSDIADLMLKKYKNVDVALVYYIKKDSITVNSLRSRKNTVDVSAIAKKHGGGGHANAAGYEI